MADQQAIEGVQRRATKLISSISHCPYPERLRILNLPSLNYRRLRGDMIFLYKITHHNSNSSLLDLFQPALTTSTIEVTNSNISNLDVIHATDRDPTSSHTETINNWNNLPSHIVNADSIKSFKNLLDNYYFDSLFIV